MVLVVKNPPANAGDVRRGFDPWVRKIAWRRAQQPTLVFLLGESHGQRSLVDYSPETCKQLDMLKWLWSSALFSRSVMSDSLQPHELQHSRPPCPSTTPRVHPNSCPSSRRCHRAISSSVVHFSSCLQSLPATESFPMSQLFAWGGHCFHCFSFYLPRMMGPDAMIFIFWTLSFKPAFLLSSFIFIKRFFCPSLLSVVRVVSSAYLRLMIFLLEILTPECVSSSLAFHIMYIS